MFHLAAQAGVRKSWGSDFRIYTDNNVDATQRLLEACVGRGLHQVRLRIELVGLWRQRHLADDGRRPASARVAVRRDKAGRRAALLSLSLRITGYPPRRCVTSPSTGRGSVPTWPSIVSFVRRSATRASRSSVTASRLATSRS